MFAAIMLLCCAQAVVPDARLARIRAHMSRVLSSLPNYTCQQTVERSVQPAGKGRFRAVDTLRVEVSFVDGKELFAWPGAEKFGEQRLEEMVGGGGAIGTGAFAMHADFVFRGAAPVFTFRGEEQENGRKLLWYDFRVPLTSSRFFISSGKKQAVVPYRGAFRVDAGTVDLVRLSVEAEEIPPAIGVARSTSTVEYARRSIGASEFLLPVASELLMVDSGGSHNRNRTRFGACRQYSGSSAISFAEPSAAAMETPARPVQGAPLPQGLTLELFLDGAVEGSGAAVGDPVSATLVRDVKKHGAVLLPKGARFSGRLTRLESHDVPRFGTYAVIGIAFESVRTGNTRTAIQGHLEEVTYGSGRYYVPFAHRLNDATAWIPVAGRPMAPLVSGEGVFLARGSLRLPAGLRMLWQTLP